MNGKTYWEILNYAAEGEGAGGAGGAAGGDGGGSGGDAGGAPSGGDGGGAADPGGDAGGAGGDGAKGGEGDGKPDGGAAAEGEGAAAAADGGDGDKVPQWATARFGQLTREKMEEKRRADATQAQLDAALALLKEKGVEVPAGGTGGGGTGGGAPAPNGQTFEQAVQAEAASRLFVTQCNKIFADGNTEFKDFHEVVIGNLNTALGAAENAQFYQAVATLEKPHKMLYHLGKNPKEASRFLTMNPMQLAVELGKLEGKLNAPPPPAKLTQTQKPITPVGGTATQITGTDLADEVPTSEWMKRRTKQVRETGRPY